MQPMLATPSSTPGVLPVGPGWSYEVKWDGVRVLADSAGGEARLWSRNEREVTAAYPELAVLSGLPDVLLDGEVVALADGIPSFEALAERMHVRDPVRARTLAARLPVGYLVFDVLRLDGLDLTGRPFDERRAVLEGLALPAPVQLSPLHDDGELLWGVTRQHGLEGVVAKRRTSVYLPGRRSPDWVKAAHRSTRTALVGGWREESTGTGRLGALLLGAIDADGRLRYLGRAGSGIGGVAGKALTRGLAPLARDTCPFDDEVPALDARGARWTEARVLVDVTYLLRTGVGRLRQPVVRGIRDDTTPDPWEDR